MMVSDYVILCASIVYCLHSGKLIKIILSHSVEILHCSNMFDSTGRLPIIAEYHYHCFILQQLFLHRVLQ
jgi:hypothetical protein